MSTGRQDFDIVHIGGVAWYDAPMPRRWHRCWAQTVGRHPDGMGVMRCACGAIGDPRTGYWMSRNERRRSKRRR